jgi:hypothetical protein
VTQSLPLVPHPGNPANDDLPPHALLEPGHPPLMRLLHFRGLQRIAKLLTLGGFVSYSSTIKVESRRGATANYLNC